MCSTNEAFALEWIIKRLYTQKAREIYLLNINAFSCKLSDRANLVAKPYSAVSKTSNGQWSLFTNTAYGCSWT